MGGKVVEGVRRLWHWVTWRFKKRRLRSREPFMYK
jgi:hypothetical protein